MEVDEVESKEKEASRKRRRSALEEAVITIMDTNCTKEKRKKVEEDKTDKQEASGSKDVDMKPVGTPDKPVDKSEDKAKAMDTSTSSATTPVGKNATKMIKLVPIKIITTPKGIKQVVHTSTPKEKEKDNTPKTDAKKPARVNKSFSNEKDKSAKDEKSRQKRRNSKNKSNSNNSLVKLDKNADKKNADVSKDKSKDQPSDKNKEIEANKSITDKSSTGKRNGVHTKGAKGNFDDNTTLATLARESSNGSDDSLSRLPTISSVRSLSTTAQRTSATTTNTTSSKNMIEVTIEANSESSIFTPTSTDNVKNMKEAVTKLQKLRSDTEKSMVGRVGVRAFARMTSPPEERRNNDVQVEIKSEPVEFDDSDRQMEKIDLMNAFQLRPVNPTTASLREVRINKVSHLKNFI